MWRSPGFFQEFLNQHGLVGDLYDAIQKDDLSDAVVVALDILKKTNNIPPLVKETKSIMRSNTHRQQGNKAYRSGGYQKALECYNKALMFAPKGSEEMVLAYSNRSALLATCKMFQACVNDINTCFDLGCPTQITDKLTRRREEVLKGLWVERMAAGVRYSEFADEYLVFDERRNPQISSASTDVGVVMESQVPKVVAIRDIKVGKLLAFEQAYMSQLDRKLKYSACHHCHKMSLNLIPCEGCCSALFCDKHCLSDCLEDYHDIECPIIDILEEVTFIPLTRLSINAAIKYRKEYVSWELFNEATNCMGLKRMKQSEINEIFDVENKLSMLSFKDDAPFKYGSVYNCSFGCAMVMNYLESETSFLPSRREEKMAAMRGFSRLLMYFSMHATHTQISSSVSVMAHGKTEFCDVANFGVFPFTGKLKGSCNPNVLVLGLNNAVALIAVQPLKAGMELTVAYLGHWLDNNVDQATRWRNMFNLYGTACACSLCNGDWKLLRETTKPNDAQLRCLRKLNVQDALADYSSDDIDSIFAKTCKTLAFLSDIPFSNEYMDVYKLFRKCLLDIQDQYTSNTVLDCTSDC